MCVYVGVEVTSVLVSNRKASGAVEYAYGEFVRGIRKKRTSMWVVVEDAPVVKQCCSL